MTSDSAMGRTKQKPDGAKHELKDMLTNEVSLVDAAANLHKFLITKRDKMAKNTQAAAAETETTKEAMAIPGEARQALIEGVMDALEKLTGVTQALKEATVDDSVKVPDELPRMIKEASDALAKVAGQYLSADATDKPATETASEENEETEKARRLTRSRRERLERLYADLGAFLAETADPSPAEQSDEQPANEDPTAKALSQIVDAIALLSGKLDKFGEVQAGVVEKAAKSADDAKAEIEKIKKELSSPGEPRSRGTEGEVTKSVNNLAWPEDLSDHVVRKMRQAG